MKKIIFFIISFIISISLIFGVADKAGINVPLLKVEKALALSGPTAGPSENPLLSGSTISVKKSSYKINKTITVKVRAYYWGQPMRNAICDISIWWSPYGKETQTNYTLFTDNKGRAKLKFKLSDFWWSYYLKPGDWIGIMAYVAGSADENSWGGIGPIVIIVK